MTITMLAMMHGRLCGDGTTDTEEGWEVHHGVNNL